MILRNPTDFARMYNWLRFQVPAARGNLSPGSSIMAVYPFLSPEAKDQWNKAVYHLEKLHKEIQRDGAYKEARKRFDKALYGLEVSYDQEKGR
jgi:DTW domain-containing protein YfiP